MQGSKIPSQYLRGVECTYRDKIIDKKNLPDRIP